MPNVGFYNGSFIAIDAPALPLEDRGTLFGDGVYEVVRVYAGKPFLFAEHWARFERSAAAIRLTVPHQREEWEAIVAEGLQKSGLQEALVYFHLTRGGGPRQHAFLEGPGHMVMTVRSARPHALADRQRGVKVCTTEDDRWANVYIKSLNLLPNVLAKQTATEKGCLEALYVRDGFVMEGSSSNVFLVADGRLVTSPADRHILNGISRQAVLMLAREMDIPLDVRPIPKAEFDAAREVFITSTSLEVMPVSHVDERILNVGRQTLTWKLWEAFQRLVEG